MKESEDAGEPPAWFDVVVWDQVPSDLPDPGESAKFTRLFGRFFGVPAAHLGGASWAGRHLHPLGGGVSTPLHTSLGRLALGYIEVDFCT